jgi:hypothetical protein
VLRKGGKHAEVPLAPRTSRAVDLYVGEGTSGPTPDGNAVASLILGLVGLTVLPVIGGLLAVISVMYQTREAPERGERPSVMARPDPSSDGSP